MTFHVFNKVINNLSFKRISLLLGFIVGVIFVSLLWSGKLNTKSQVNLLEGYNEQPKVHKVVFDESGFSPENLQILEGDSVVFEIGKKNNAWPASDPHPTHTSQAEFDPKRVLLAGEHWLFTFKNFGVWRYHDHLSPSVRGSITVSPRTKGGTESLCTSGEKKSSELLCFEEEVRFALKNEGVDAAWDVFERLYENGRTPQSCHWTAHFIGEEAYKLFRTGKEIPISRATSYCGYGFFHGFLELLLRANPDPKNALRFCDQVDAKLGSMGLQNCYHGIGHGYTEDPPDPLTEGNFEAMVAPGIKVCEALFGGFFVNLNLCLTGVFTVPAGFAAKGEYGLEISPSAPFSYCRNQPYRYLKACYGEFAPKLDKILDWDLDRLPPYVAAISDEKLKQLVTWVVPSVMMAHDILKTDHSNYIKACRDGFTPPLREICWGGAILGFFQHGRPEYQYEELLKFCALAAWREDERGFCYGEGFRRMRMEYDSIKIRDICLRAPEQYRNFCFDEKKQHKSPYSDPSFDNI